MDKEMDFNKYKEEHTDTVVEEIICVKCLHRCISVRPKKTWLKNLGCPKCHKSGYIIGTGQILEVDE